MIVLSQKHLHRIRLMRLSWSMSLIHSSSEVQIFKCHQTYFVRAWGLRSWITRASRIKLRSSPSGKIFRFLLDCLLSLNRFMVLNRDSLKESGKLEEAQQKLKEVKDAHSSWDFAHSSSRLWALDCLANCAGANVPTVYCPGIEKNMLSDTLSWSPDTGKGGRWGRFGRSQRCENGRCVLDPASLVSSWQNHFLCSERTAVTLLP